MNSPFIQFLLFDFLITTWIVRIVYWLGELSIIVICFSTMFVEGDLNRAIIGDDDPNFFLGLLILVFGSLILRLLTESMIVLFKISENTSQLKKP